MIGWYPFTRELREAFDAAGVRVLPLPARRCEECPRWAQLLVPSPACTTSRLCVPCTLARTLANVTWARVERDQALAIADRLPLRGHRIVSAPDAGACTTHHEGDDPGALHAPGVVSMPAPG